MNSKNQNLIVRIVVALSLLPLVLWLVYEGGYYTAALTGVAAAACAAEYFKITGVGFSPPSWIGLALAGLFPFLPVLKPQTAGAIGFWLLAAYFLLVWTYLLVAGPRGDAPARAGNLLTGLLYGAFGMTALSTLRGMEHGGQWVVCAMAVTWSNDTAAYFAGRAFGRHKLFPEVSPNKTWEGFFGGMAGSIGSLFIVRAVVFPELTVLDCLLVGIAGGILGPAGDLCESMLKRAHQVKDSGTLIPGHGGMLDRVDALLFNGPMVFLYARYLRALWE